MFDQGRAGFGASSKMKASYTTFIAKPRRTVPGVWSANPRPTALHPWKGRRIRADGAVQDAKNGVRRRYGGSVMDVCRCGKFVSYRGHAHNVVAVTGRPSTRFWAEHFCASWGPGRAVTSMRRVRWARPNGEKWFQVPSFRLSKHRHAMRRRQIPPPGPRGTGSRCVNVRACRPSSAAGPVPPGECRIECGID